MFALRPRLPQLPRLAATCLLLASGLVAAEDNTADHEDWTARFQTTYVRQTKPAMRALYSGDKSLYAGKEMSYSGTLTGYFGLRPWQGGELYLNPEITQGIPFSGLTGSAGFTNGELTRTAGSNPKIYRQRLFLRQTWGLGGGDEQIESGLNQMASTVDKNRLVLTVGNFSVLDVFDNNSYAKDPRSQFMNAAFMTYLSYDYAADARGFGWGYALEWHRDDWTLRIGRMTGPEEPNMLPTDYQIGKHYGDQIELERRHTLDERPGKIRLLGWRNRAKVARFDDALAYYNATGGTLPQSILAVRNHEQLKYGVGINIEQELADRFGFFLRAMRADGRSETYAFTETDASLATGLVLQGAGWGRERDTLGIAYARNAISDARRRYLEAGGISFFIGDGRLNYRPEQIIETYYSIGLAKNLSLTLDYQRMQNPAYNADRGPANFYAIRAHAEF